MLGVKDERLLDPIKTSARCSRKQQNIAYAEGPCAPPSLAPQNPEYRSDLQRLFDQGHAERSPAAVARPEEQIKALAGQQCHTHHRAA